MKESYFVLIDGFRGFSRALVVRVIMSVFLERLINQIKTLMSAICLGLASVFHFLGVFMAPPSDQPGLRLPSSLNGEDRVNNNSNDNLFQYSRMA